MVSDGSTENKSLDTAAEPELKMQVALSAETGREVRDLMRGFRQDQHFAICCKHFILSCLLPKYLMCAIFGMDYEARVTS